MIKPMLLHETDAPFDDPAYCYQLKWDGIRCIAVKASARVRLWSRHGKEMTSQFPEVVAAIAGMTAEQAILDGELVALTPDGRPDFYAVMQRHGQGRAERIARAARTQPATFMAFDVLEVDGRLVTTLPLRERQPILESIVRPGPSLALVESWPGTSGNAAAKAVADRDLEGIVAKRLDSPYRLDTRSKDWLKVKFWHRAECTILALRREPFGSLVGEAGRPVAMVELGWRPDDRRVLYGLLEELREREEGGLVWLTPALKCRVRYRLTPDGKIREPLFDGWPAAEAA